jgi:FkbM family methyltransferase
VRKLLNGLLEPLGYRLERLAHFQRQIDLLLEPGTPLQFVQIGANDGVRFDDLYSIVTNAQFSGIVVEPLPDIYRRLQLNYADYPTIIPVNVAVHEQEGTLPLYRVAPASVGRYPGWVTGIASFDREHLLRHKIAPDDVIAEEVKCVPMMTLLERTGMLGAHLLQIDTEGYDAAILGMIDFTAFRPTLIKFEHKNMSTAVRESTTRRLRMHGYTCAPEGTDTVAWRTSK